MESAFVLGDFAGKCSHARHMIAQITS